MKSFLAVASLLTVGLLQAEANLKNLKPLDIVKPVYPKYTAQEWKEIYAAQKPSPEYYPNFKKGTELESEHAVKVHVPLDEQHRITGGNIASPTHVPWLAAIIIDNAYFCGGSLISSLWILTAARCAGSNYQIILGANRYDGSESGSLMVTSSTSIVHEQFDENTMNNDIALIQLPSEISFTSYISPVRLRNVTDNLEVKQVLLTEEGGASGTVLCKFLVISNTACAVYGNIITSNMICTFTGGDTNTCSCTSGGPLVYLESDDIYTQVGIASLGFCQQGYPAAFTRVTSYLSWIESNTGIALTL